MSKPVKLLVGIAILACGCVFSVFGQDPGTNLLKKWEIPKDSKGITVIQEDGVIVCECKGGKEVSGVFQIVELNQKEAKAIKFSAESKSEIKAETTTEWVDPADYSIYLDITHPDGSKTNGVVALFQADTHDWEKVSLSYTPTKPIKSLFYFLLFRNKTGKVWFKNATLIQK
jgi:predicted transcriptional regulator